jgi:hypothetical protein
MRTEHQTKLRIERFIAGLLLLIAAIVSGTNLLQLLRAAETREVNAAANNYSAVRKIYSDQSKTGAPSGTMRLVASNTSDSERLSSR